jgi:hypothetical protein
VSPVRVCSPALLAQASPLQEKPQGAPTQAAPPPSAGPKGFVLEDATPVKLRINRTVSSADAKEGDTIDFDVLEDVQVNGVLVVPKGGLAFATVTEAQNKRRMGRGGKLDINIDYVRLLDNERAPLRAVKEVKGGGHTAAMTGGIVATSLVFFPAAPFFLFMHGKDITIPKGTAIIAFVQGDDVLDRSKFIRQAQLSAPAAPKQQPIAQAPAMDQSSFGGQSVADAARQNRAKKPQQQDQPQQAQQQDPNQ